MFAAALEREKESAGVVVGFDTDVVNKGDRFPLEKLETVPTPDGAIYVFNCNKDARHEFLASKADSFVVSARAGCATALTAPAMAKMKIRKILPALIKPS